MNGGGRPRPRLEGQRNPALSAKDSPYGDGARVVPKKLGMRALAARRLLGGKTPNIYRKSNETYTPCGSHDTGTEVETS